ncbi:MAG: GAF domain-containing protein, partial [Bacteroidia bacterium]|nr:GAF domain-containing protein [Bacteroidia bacterium]
FVPLIIGDKVTSYVSLQNVDKENAFSDSDVRLLETLANSMSTALENARLLKETEQRTAELAVINSVQDALAKEMDIQAIYDLVGNRIRELFDAQVVGIATFDYKTETEHIHYLIEKGERYYPVPRPLNTLRKHLIQTKEKILINKNFEAVTAAFGLKNVPGTEPPKSAVYVPMMVGDKVTGNISLQNVDRENAISDSDVRLLETLANSMSVALENARLFDETTRLLKETEQQKAELGVINSVQGGLARELDMQAIYDLVGDRIRELFNAQAVMIVTFDHETATEDFKYLIEDGQRFYLAPRPYDRLRQHLIISKQKIVINTNYAEAYAQFGLKILPGTKMTKSGVFVPLIIGDKVNSYISLQNMEIENAFSESDVRLLETLANSMSVALENARLFDETNRLLKETEQRTAELAVINSVQGGLARELDMNAIYDLVGNKIREVFDAQGVIIATFDHDTGTEKFNYLIEKGERYNAEPRRYDKLRYQLIMTKQKILINNNTEETFKEFGLKVVEGTEMPKSLLYVPLIVGNKVTSYVSLQNVDRENAFGESDVRLLETLANSMSVALENARLFDETNRLLKETEQGKAELAVINSVQAGLVKEMDIQGIYNLVGNRIQTLFSAQVVIIATFEHEKKLEHYNYHFEKGETSHPEPRHFDKVRMHLIETGQNILINEDVPKAVAEFGMRVVPGTEMPKSLLFMPLKVGEKVNGYVSLQNIDQENAFSFSDVRLLSTLANSMSVALENARLFDETNRLLKITEQGKAELGVINSVQESLVAQMDMNEIYELVGEKIREIFGAQVIDIATYDSDTDIMEDRYAYEKGDRTLVGSWKPFGFRKHVIDTGQMLVINENLSRISERYNSKVLHGEQPKSAVFVPMLSGGKVTGMVSLQNLDRENAFPESSVSLLTTLSNSMSVALESAHHFDETNRLLKETEQRNAELAVINSVQESLVAQMDMQGIYDLVGEKIREIFKAQVIDIVIYDKKTNLIEDRYSFEKGDRTLVGQREPKGFRKHVIQSKQLLLHNENVAQAVKDFDNAIMIGEMPKSQIYVPMMAGGDVTGIISLQNLDHEHAFSDSDVNLITTLANSMSVALESARLFDETNRLLKETEQRTAELSVINSVQEGLAKELDIQGIYELVGEKIREIFKAQVIDIVTYDQKTNVIEDRYAFEKGDRTLLGAREAKGFRKHVIRSKQLLLHNENVERAMREYDNEILIGEVPKSQIYVPLFASGEVSGIISLQNLDHEQAFSDSDVNLITTLANSMSVALESARLFDETNRLLKETEQRTAELGIINSVQGGLAKELNIQGIYELVGEKMREIFNAQVIDIVTYDNLTNLLEDRYSFEKGDRTLAGTWKPEGFRKSVIESGQLLLINEDLEKKSLEFNSKVLQGEQPKSAVFVPLVSGNEVKGMISLQNLDIEHAFSDSDVNLLTTLANSMTVALESARLFDETNRLLKETEQRTAELSVINSVQEGLAKELDIQGIYELVGEKMREIFNAQVIDIVTYDKVNNTVEDRYTYEKGDRTLLGPRPLKGFRKHVIETAKALVINKDLHRERSKFDQSVIIGKGAKSIVLVPMIASGEVTGVISLQNLDQEDAFPDSDVNLLSTLSNSMSVALESARLFDETTRLLKETEQRTGELSVINSVQEGLAKELDMQGIYDLIGDRVQKLFNAQSVIIATLDLDNKVEHFNYAVENGKKYHHASRPINKLRRLLIEKKHSIYIPTEEIAERDYGLSAIPGTKMSKSLLFVPLLTGNVIRGYVSLQNVDIDNAFSESDIRLLETLSNSMSVALENARLFDETNRLLKETEQRTAELGIINSVQEGLASKLDIQAVYDLVGDKIRDVFDTQGISISYYDHAKNYITNPYYLFKGKRIYDYAFELGRGLTSHIIHSGQPLLINENAIERYNELGAVFAPSETEDAAKSWLGVPLVSGGKVNGTIRLENYEREHAYTESDVSLLQTLANSMSVALENARLFDETNRLLKETEQRKAELAVINNVQEGLVKEFKSKEIYELVGEKLCELFDTQTVLIRTFDLESGTEIWRYAMEKGIRQITEPRPLIWANKKLIENHKPILINKDYAETAKQYGGSGVSMGMAPKSAVFVPMIVGDVVRGSVSLQNVDKEFAFTESDLGLLTTLTNSMGVALENARLFDETTTLLSEAKQRATELSTVNSISKALASQLDPDDLIQMVGDQLKNLFTANIVYLALLNNKTKTIHFPYRFGDEMSPIKLGEGLTSKIILSGEPLLVNKDVQELTNQLGVQRMGIPSASYLGVPIPVGDEIIGVLSVQSTEHENQFNEDDLRLLSTIASSVGVALRNAQLFEEV